MNKVELLGRLTKDIELKEAKNGKKYAKFTLAVPKAGDKDKTNFIDCIVFDKMAETIEKYVDKGKRIIVSGELNIEIYEDKDNNKKTSVSILVNDFYFVDFKAKN